jgi:UDP-GlcNAc3NAcA epimerase
VQCVTLRENTEWVETLDGGWNVLVGTEKSKIKKALYSSLPACRERNGFEREGASERILNTLRCLKN